MTRRQGDKETRRQGDKETIRNSLLLFFSLFIPLIANAQTGEITGRVVSEDGGGMPNVTVHLYPIGSVQRATSNDQPESAVTDPSLAAPNAGTSVALYNASTGFYAGTSSVRPGNAQSGFAILGVTDGEYEIIARRALTENEYLTSPPHRITVEGADLSGIELRLAPTAMVSGKVVEASPKVCESDRKSPLEDIIVSARRATKAPSALWFLRPYLYTSSMDDKGEFTIYRLDPDNYFIIARLPDENRFVKSIAAPAATARRGSLRPVATYDVARSGLAVKSGDRIKGLIVTIADGAASLRGKVAPENEGSRLPARMIIHLVPAETAAANDLLRYGEVAVGKDNAFEFKNMAPGKYRLLVRAAPDDETTDIPPAPVAWDTNERAKLRKEAETMNVEVELKPCQRVTDQVVKYVWRP